MTARRSLAVAMLVVPLLITAIAVAVMVLGTDLAREAPIHWGPSGPEGWGPAWIHPLLVGSLGVVLPVTMWLVAGRSGRVGATAVFLAGLMIWLAAFLAIGLGAALLAPPADVGWWFLAAAAVGLVLAAPAWLWLPRESKPAAELVALPVVALAPGEVAGWSRRALAPPVFYWTVPLVIVVTLGLAIVATVATAGRAGAAFVAPVLLAGMFALVAGWRVGAGPAGLTVRGLLGVPVFRVPLGDIVGASAVEVEPTADFGGWGVRWVPIPGGRHRTAVVVRAGEAIQVDRRDGRQFVVTVDDAAMGAAVIRAHLAAAGSAR